jgi:hypothetical protein
MHRLVTSAVLTNGSDEEDSSLTPKLEGTREGNPHSSSDSTTPGKAQDHSLWIVASSAPSLNLPLPEICAYEIALLYILGYLL